MRRGILRAAFALLCALAWLVQTNHCALVGMAASTASCPHCAQHGGKPGAPATMDCCGHLKITAPVIHSFQFAAQCVAVLEYPSVKYATFRVNRAGIAATGAGPPLLISLQRSAQSHAPPSLV